MSDQEQRRALVAKRNAKRYYALAGTSAVAWVGYMVIMAELLWTPAIAVAWFGYRGWAESRESESR